MSILIKPFQLVVDLTQVEPHKYGLFIGKLAILFSIANIYYIEHWNWGVLFITAFLVFFVWTMNDFAKSPTIYAYMSAGRSGSFILWFSFLGTIFLLLVLIAAPTTLNLIRWLIDASAFCWFGFAGCRPPAPPKRKHSFNLSSQT